MKFKYTLLLAILIFVTSYAEHDHNSTTSPDKTIDKTLGTIGTFPRDGAFLMRQMSEIIDYIDSPEYAAEVSWPEHIVLCYQLVRGKDPSLVEFTIINHNRRQLEMDRHTVLAMVLADKHEVPTWEQVRQFESNHSVFDFRSTPRTLSKAEELAATPVESIRKALEFEERKELAKNGEFPTKKDSVQQEEFTTKKYDPEQRDLPGTNYNTYFGFLHAHSNLSDGSGGPEEAYAHARDAAGLDFFALTDHGVNMLFWPWESNKYDRLLSAADQYDAPGSYAALYGFEWSHPLLGHINVMNVRSFTHVLRRITLNSIYRWIGDRVYSIARYNHPGRQDSTNDEFKHFRYESYVANNMVGLEVWNKGHDFDEQFYLCTWGSCQAPTFMSEGIRKGWRLGPLGGGDNHHREWGTNTDFRVAVLSTQLNRNAIVNAYFDRRFYATEDKNMLLDIRVGGNPMGSRLTGWHREFRMEASDSAGDTFSEVRFYRDGYLIDTRLVSGNSIAETFTDPGVSGNNHYYVVVRQADGDEAVSSPIYMNGAPPTPEAQACFTKSCNGFSCSFNASCSTGEGGIVNYAWNFGDGNTASGVNVSHSFASSNTYNVRLTVTDTINQTDSTTQQVTVNCGDTVRPNVTLTAPAHGATLWGNRTFSANASDNLGVDKVQFKINNQVVCTDNNPPTWSCSANVNSFATDDYTVKAVAFDECGNFKVSNSRSVRIVSNPEMAIDLPAVNSAVSGEAVRISGWATDPNRVTSLSIMLDGAVTIPVTYGTLRPNVCQAVPVNDPNCPNVGFEATFNSKLYENGPHSIQVIATDAQGKRTTQNINFTIDNPPVVNCTPGPHTLCLQNNRFKVQAFYVNGGTGQQARTRPYSNESGFFWFFGSNNLEVGVKVIGPANGQWWVFHGAGTDREYTIAVTDTQTGEIRSYVKPNGSFCGDADTQAFPASSNLTALDSNATFDNNLGFFDSKSNGEEILSGSCSPSSTSMCLQSNRFRVEVLRNNVKQPVEELTADTGTSWFFNPYNAEVFVKVLDGRNANGHFWVFYGSLSDRDFTVKVVDTVTGQEVNYNNALGDYCGNGDTAAFPQ